MRPLLFILLTLITLTTLLWIRSYWRCDKLELCQPTWRALESFRGRIYYCHSFATEYHYPLYSSEQVYDSDVRYAIEEPHWQLLGVRTGGSYSGGFWYIGLPMAYPLATFLLLAAHCYRKIRRQHPRAFPVDPLPANAPPPASP